MDRQGAGLPPGSLPRQPNLDDRPRTDSRDMSAWLRGSAGQPSSKRPERRIVPYKNYAGTFKMCSGHWRVRFLRVGIAFDTSLESSNPNEFVEPLASIFDTCLPPCALQQLLLVFGWHWVVVVNDRGRRASASSLIRRWQLPCRTCEGSGTKRLLTSCSLGLQQFKQGLQGTYRQPRAAR